MGEGREWQALDKKNNGMELGFGVQIWGTLSVPAQNIFSKVTKFMAGI